MQLDLSTNLILEVLALFFRVYNKSPFRNGLLLHNKIDFTILLITNKSTLFNIEN